MLEGIVSIYDDMTYMMKKLKKKRYEENMTLFMKNYGHFFEEMINLVEQSEDKDACAGEIARVLTEETEKKFTKFGRIFGYVQVNVNFFAIYYIFPAILLTKSGQKPLKEGDERSIGTFICDTIRDKWNKSFKDTNLNYTDYDSLYKAFNEKIFGIF